MAVNNTPLVLDFNLDNDGKNAVRFKELNKNGEAADPFIMGKVYVKKDQLEEWGNPKELEVEVRPKRKKR